MDSEIKNEDLTSVEETKTENKKEKKKKEI